MDLLDQWSRWKPDSPPHILEEDREILLPLEEKWVLTNWEEVHNAPNFGALGDRQLHLGLLPQPFCGDLRRASIYVLMLNPGLGLQDYFGEYEVPAYRRALLGTLTQDCSRETIPFLFLDPRFSWHGGYRWWHGKLARIIEQLAQSRRLSFSEARALLGNNLASIELVPYHSVGFDNAGGLARKLPSAKLAWAFVNEFVLPRVKLGEAIVIVARKARVWNLPEISGVVRYDKDEARGAHLGPKSRGGQAILEHLAKVI